MPHNKKHTKPSDKFLHTQDYIYMYIYMYTYILKLGTTKPDTELQYHRKELYFERKVQIHTDQYRKEDFS